MRRRLALAVGAFGAVLAVLGLASTVVPGLLAGVPANEAFVVGVGVVAIGLGVAELRGSRAGGGRVRAPSVESRTTSSVPGVEFDAALAARDPAVRERLRELAVRTLVVHGGHDEGTARELVEDGTWTTDRVAAAFFSPTVAAEADRSLDERARAALGFASVDVVEQVRRVVDALADVTTVTLDVMPEDVGSVDDRGDADPWADSRHGRGTGAVGGRRGREAEVRGGGAVGRRPVEADGGRRPRAGTAGTGRQTQRRSFGWRDAAETGRWRGFGSLALVAAGVAAVVREPAVLLAAGVPAALAAYGRYAAAGDPPEPSLAVERTVSTASPNPGEDVNVTVTVRNDGDRRLLDCRYVDGVPRGLAVVDGTARTATTLAPGETATVAYDVRATVGRHEFEAGTVVVRGGSAVRETTTTVEATASAEAALVCRFQPADGAASTPLRPQTTEQTGAVPTDAGGEGVEFFGVREYRQGDPQSLVDWKRFARTGELSTIQYREERTVSVMLLVDAREDAYLAPETGELSSMRRSVDAAVTVLDGLLGAGHRVGVSAVTPRDAPWLSPGSGREHRVRARDLLATHPALSPTPPDERYLRSAGETELFARLSGDAQVVLFSPCCDDYPTTLARRLEARGHATTVVSPDPTTTDTVGGALARVERAVRLAGVRRSDLPVHDWGRDEHLVRAVTEGDGRV